MEQSVWVVIEGDRGCGSFVLGVFPDEQKALDFAAGYSRCDVQETVFYKGE